MLDRLAVLGLLFAVYLAPGGAAAETPALAPEGCAWTSVEGFLSCEKQGGGLRTLRAPYGFGPDTVAKAQAGDPHAAHLMMRLYGDGDPPLHMERRNLWMKRAAEAGDGGAMGALGVRLMEGDGLARDTAEGLRWLKASADKGRASAMAALGYYYATGRGVAKDSVEAARWHRRGAEGGDKDAMLNWAIANERGLGVAKNKEEARFWRTRAAQMTERARGPTADEMQLAYPVEAAAADVEGRVVLRCALDGALFVSGCGVETEEPKGWGFGQAALLLAPTVQMLPGLPPGSEIRLPMPFRLVQRAENRRTTDQCAAYTIAMEKDGSFSGLRGWWASYWKARSRRLAGAAGEAADLGPLEPQVAAAAERLAQGKDRGPFGVVDRCHLG